MARRHRSSKRELIPDPKFQNREITRFVNQIMRKGKKTVAQRILYSALDEVERKSKENPVELFENAIENVRPQLEVKSRRVGGATYQVPMELSAERSRSRKGVPLANALANELLDAHNNTGSAIKKRDDTHKMAQANRAFAHYRW
jgi:small subunit ribosomal protein S7